MAGLNATDSTSLVGLAIINGQNNIARLLLENGADPNAPDSRGSLLHTLAWMRRPGSGRGLPPDPVGDSLELAKVMLARGANPNVRIAWQEIPFDLDDGEAKSPPNVPAGRDFILMSGVTPYFLAAKNGDVALMRLLIANGADPRIPNVHGRDGIHGGGRVRLLGRRVPRSTEWDFRGRKAGSGETGAGAERRRREWRPPTSAARLSSMRTAKICSSLIPSSTASTRRAVRVPEATMGDVRWAGSTALHGAALLGQESIIRFLLEKGARLDARNKAGWTPLMVTQGMLVAANARFYPKAEALLKQLMIERGMDPAKYSRRPVTTSVVKQKQVP